jgi:hypothetical protein
MKRLLFSDFLFPFVLFWLILKAVLPAVFERWAVVSASALGLISGVILCLWVVLILVIVGSVERPTLFYAFLTLASLAPFLPADFFPPIPEAFLDLFRWGLIVGVTGWVGRSMTREMILLPLTLVAITLDVFAFLRGLYPRLPQMPVFAPFLLPLPEIAAPAPASPFTPFLLYTDLFFIGYFFICCYELGLNRFWNAVLLFIVTSGALFVPASFGLRLPVLPFIGLFFLAGNWRNLKFHKDEIGVSFAFFAAMFILLGIMMLTGR